ncbi:MAG TPA: DUF3034 family protein [Cycloclasticus sp.]|jgi:hypothetical protein|nr:DUF3034 family protein [Cycloclasticus sp.]HIL92316.1 DUF3034 family protein [Cycloclasticus sp.]
MTTKALVILFTTLFCNSLFAAPPFMNFEGVGGGGIVPGAYRVNPPKNGETFGKPAISNWDLIGLNESNDNLYTNGITISFLDRYEMGYVLEQIDFRRVRATLLKATNGTMDVKRNTIYMHNVHFKTVLAHETDKLPAFAFTAEFKYNETIDEQNRNINHALNDLGFDDNVGIDLDFSVSNTNTSMLGYPVVFHGNIRLTKGHYLGLLGFSDNYTANAEASIAIIPTQTFGYGFEIRQQNDKFKAISSDLDMKEDAFWDVFVTWMPNKKLSFAAAFTRFGNIVDKDVDFFVFNAKYDF